MYRRLFALLAGCLPFTPSVHAQAVPRERVGLVVDSIVAAALADGRAAGMAVAVVRGGDTLVFKGYGKVDLEWDVPTPTDAIYEIGSVTKQFTATALLRLVDEGKVDLDADVTTYLPDLDTQGHRVPVRRLLDHTSGIRSYTEMRGFGTLRMARLPRDTLVRLVQQEPFDFAPGERLVYNNSAYFLLGLLIEKVSGLSYADYLARHLFEPLGISNSRYCSEQAVISRRANGYEMSPGGLVRASYLDHTWPYAAGSLCSTIGDLVTWTRALHGGRVLSAPMYRLLVTPEPLNDGTPVRYAKGLAITEVAGHPVIAHGGGINGFLSGLTWFPESETVIVVLVNTSGPVQPGAITADIAAAALGRRAGAAGPFTGDATAYAGTYRGIGRGQPLTITLVLEEGRLLLRGQGGRLEPLEHLGGERFAAGTRRFEFVREGGAVTRLRVDFVSVVSVLEKQ